MAPTCGVLQECATHLCCVIVDDYQAGAPLAQLPSNVQVPADLCGLSHREHIPAPIVQQSQRRLWHCR